MDSWKNEFNTILFLIESRAIVFLLALCRQYCMAKRLQRCTFWPIFLRICQKLSNHLVKSVGAQTEGALKWASLAVIVDKLMLMHESDYDPTSFLSPFIFVIA